MVGVDPSGIKIQMVRIRTGGIIVGVLGRSDPQSTRRMEQVLNADFGARVSGCLPFGDRGSLSELIRASIEQDAKQRGCDALAHGPAFEWSTHAYSVAIALCNEVALPGDDEGCRQSLGWFESRVDSRLEFCRIDLARQRLLGSTSPMGQGTVSASGNLLFTTTGVKWTAASQAEASHSLGCQGIWLSELSRSAA